MVRLSSIDLRIADRLKDPEFRRHWFRSMLEDNVPEQFRGLRETRKWTQSELADAADMKQSAISRFEVQRVANWKLETLLKLADALDAQLEIVVTPSEEVIARHAREEATGGTPQASVLQAKSAWSNEKANPLLAEIERRGKSEAEPKDDPDKSEEDLPDAKLTAAAAAINAARDRRGRRSNRPWK